MVNDYKKPILIYNPKAANGKGEKIYNNYYKILMDYKLFEKIDVYKTSSKDDTINEIVKIHSRKKHDLLISIGGDGSISTICNGLMKIPKNKRLPLLPLPSGTGNSLLRDFNILNIHDSVKNYKNEKPKMFDLIYMEEIDGNFKWYCINVLGMGFVSDIADYVVRKGKIFGALSYIFAIVLAIGRFKPYKTTIKYNNGKHEFKSDRAFFITFSNTKYMGGNVRAAPEAQYDDGLMDVMILYDINRFQLLNGFRKTFSGKHIYEEKCLYFQTSDLEVYADPKFIIMPDGELEGNSPIRARVISKQVKLVV